MLLREVICCYPPPFQYTPRYSTPPSHPSLPQILHPPNPIHSIPFFHHLSSSLPPSLPSLLLRQQLIHPSFLALKLLLYISSESKPPPAALLSNNNYTHKYTKSLQTTKASSKEKEPLPFFFPTYNMLNLILIFSSV